MSIYISYKTIFKERACAQTVAQSNSYTDVNKICLHLKKYKIMILLSVISNSIFMKFVVEINTVSF